MSDLMQATRRGVLDGYEGGSGVARLTPAKPASRISLRAPAGSLDALSGALGVAIPTRPKTSASANGRHVLWIGPDEWLVIDENGADLMGITAGSGALHSATDVSHRNTAIIVTGAKAAEAINGSCTQDLSLSVFPVGACSRTLLGKAEVVLYRTAEDVFRVEVWRSFASFAFGLLDEAAKDAMH